MRSEYRIREVEADDIIQVIWIAGSELREEYDSKLFSHFYEGFRKGFLVADDGSEVLGFVLGAPMDNLTLRILMLAVKREFTGRGIGRSLLEGCMQYARLRNMGSIVLEVREGNEGAISFYRRAGFREVGSLEGFYNDGGKAIVMKHYLCDRAPSSSP